MTESRTIRVEALTRVEGEGGLYIRLRGDTLEEVRLEIFEPPRLFEAFLRGRPLEDVPDVTARICGICPVAYQMSSVHALEQALGLTIPEEIEILRRLLYCGEWIESHALHMHLLHVPDFLGYDSGLALAADFPNEVNRGLRLKKHGNALLEVLGGRAIHPVNVAVGGFYHAPRREEFSRLIPDFEWGLQAAVDTARWVATLPFPEFEQNYEMVSLVHPNEYPMNRGELHSTAGLQIPVQRFEEEFEEVHVPHSTALHCVRLPERTPYMVGPLARLAFNRDRLSPTARRVADEVGLEEGCRNPYKALVARGVELIHAYEEALQIIRNYTPLRQPRLKYEHRDGEGMAATEAPRGMLYHRYEVNARGEVVFAKIVPPTSQNQSQIEADLRSLIPRLLQSSDAEAAVACERLVRSYDPCISCSTHFLRVKIDRA